MTARAAGWRPGISRNGITGERGSWERVPAVPPERGAPTGREPGARPGDADADIVRAGIEELACALARLTEPDFTALLHEIADAVCGCLRSGGRVLFCGNGGSAADAQHLAAELVGRQNYDHGAAAGLALTADTSVLTAIGNDYGFEQVFARQIEALGRPGDMLIELTTSGRSTNVVLAHDAARVRGVTTVAFTGKDPADLAGADLVLAVPAVTTARIQELHITCAHLVLAIVERRLFPR